MAKTKSAKSKPNPADEASLKEDAQAYEPFAEPPFFKRLMTIGHLIGFILALAVVYVAWGMLFTPGGTGSNVVLALLVALVAVYMIATHSGPIIDSLFQRKSKDDFERERSVDYAHSLLSEAKRFIAQGEKKGTAVEKSKARAHQLRLVINEAVDNVAGTAEISTASDALERAMRANGHKKPGPLTQMRSLGMAFAVALALRAFVAEPFQIPSGSMIPTLKIGDHIFVARYAYGMPIPLMKKYLVRWATPAPGDVIVFTAPKWVGENSDTAWVKRVIAGPGQKVRVRDTVVYVDDRPYSHVGKRAPIEQQDYDPSRGWNLRKALAEIERIGDKDHDIHLYPGALRDFPGPGKPVLNGMDCTLQECTVKEGFVFVMGDNRHNSVDGRFWGAVPIDYVKGKAAFIWISVDGSRESLELGKFALPGFRWDRTFMKVR